LTAQIVAGAATDAAGNANTASNVLSRHVNKLFPLFSNLTSATINAGDATPVTLGGHIEAGGEFPTGSVSITVHGITVTAPVDSAGDFSTSITVSALAGALYPISFSYPGDFLFAPALDNSSATLAVFEAPHFTQDPIKITIDVGDFLFEQLPLTGYPISVSAVANFENLDGFPTGLNMHLTSNNGRLYSSSPILEQGLYILQVQATNLLGTDTAEVQLYVRKQNPNTPVINSASANPSPAIATHPITFDASASDADGDHLEFIWNLGDGTISHEHTFEHAFAAPGFYDVQLTVSDGQKIASKHIYVKVVGPNGTEAAFTVKKSTCNMNFKKPTSSSILMSGIVQAPRPVSTGTVVTIDIGSGALVRAITLTNQKKGAISSDPISYFKLTQTAGGSATAFSNFTCKLLNSQNPNDPTIASQLKDLGFINTSTPKEGTKLTVPISFTFTNTSLPTQTYLNLVFYKAKVAVKGTGKGIGAAQ